MINELLGGGNVELRVRGSQGLPLMNPPAGVEKWRREVESALNEARRMRSLGHPDAYQRGLDAMREYASFAQALGGPGKVFILSPESEPPPYRMTARRQTALRDARREFRRERREEGFATA